MLESWFIVAFAVLIAAMSPGPDFVIAVRNAVTGTRRTGFLTALGFGLGVGVHVSYCLAGLAAVIAQSIVLFSVLKILGAAYLFYIGFKALRSKGMSEETDVTSGNGKRLTDGQALRSGFLTNLLNPKATLFFLALFTQTIGPETGFGAKILYGATAMGVVTMWFSIVALVLTTPALRRAYLKVSRWIDRLCGGFLVLMGVRLALSRS